jgi:hypothetical protein
LLEAASDAFRRMNLFHQKEKEKEKEKETLFEIK